MGDKANIYGYWRKSAKGEATIADMLPTGGKGEVTLHNLNSADLGGMSWDELVKAGGGVVHVQPGLWKIEIGWTLGLPRGSKKYVPMQTWLTDESGASCHIWREGLKVVGEIDGKAVPLAKLERHWYGAAYLSKADKDFYFKHGRWPEDAPAAVEATPALIAEVNETEAAINRVTGTTTITEIEKSPPPAKGSVPADNSGDPQSFEAMRAKIRGEITEAKHYFQKHPINSLAEANKCENWRKRIHELMKEADALRVKFKKPHDDAAAEVQKLWKPLVDEAEAGHLDLKKTADTWIKAEQKRLQDEAIEQRRKEIEAENARRAEEARRVAEENARIEAERVAMMRDDPIAAITGSMPELVEAPPPPIEVPKTIVVEQPKIMLGTTGTRRSAREAPATATINDLAAAAKFYAEQQHPDLVAVIQKLADKAAKARSVVPGVTMSWQTKTEDAA